MAVNPRQIPFQTDLYGRDHRQCADRIEFAPAWNTPHPRGWIAFNPLWYADNARRPFYAIVAQPDRKGGRSLAERREKIQWHY